MLRVSLLSSLISRIVLFALLVCPSKTYSSAKDSLIQNCYFLKVADTTKAHAFNELCQLYFNEANHDSSIIVLEDGLTFALRHPFQKPNAETHEMLRSIADLHLSLGTVSYTVGKIDQAAENWFQSLKYFDYLYDQHGRSEALTNVANLQIDNKEFDKAESNLNEVLNIQRDLKDSIGMTKTYNAFGFMYRKSGNDSLALVNYQKSLQLKIQLNSIVSTAISRNNIAYVYRDNEDYQSAMIEYERAYFIYDSIDYTPGRITLLNNMASCEFDAGNLYKAKKHADLSLELLTPFDLIEDKMYVAQTNYNIYKALGKNGMALKFHEDFILYKDSLQNKDHYKELINQELTYNFEKKELEQEKQRAIEDLEYQNEINLAQEKSSNLILLSVIISIGALILIILSVFIYRQLQLVKSQKTVIEKQNKEIEMKALRSQMNPHFLFNSLNSIKHFIVKNESEVAAKYLTKFAKLIRLVLENSKHNLISLSEELDSLRYYLELESIRFEGKFQFIIEGETDIDFIQVPPLILQPFVENSIWHGIMNKQDGQGLIKINVCQAENGIQVEIEDNGIGRDAAAKFSATNSSKKKSMGIDITHKRLETLNKIIGINSKIEVIDLYDNNKNSRGTRVILTLPHHD